MAHGTLDETGLDVPPATARNTGRDTARDSGRDSGRQTARSGASLVGEIVDDDEDGTGGGDALNESAASEDISGEARPGPAPPAAVVALRKLEKECTQLRARVNELESALAATANADSSRSTNSGAAGER
jgi:hypothetical protein